MKGIIVIFLFVGALMGVQFFAFPLITDVRQQWSDIAEMQKILEDAERTKEDRVEFLDRLSNIDGDDLRKLEILVPNRVASEDLYVFLNDLVKTANLEAKTINIADIGGKAGDKSAQKALNFDMEVVGPYNNMRNLLTSMEMSLRLMDIESLVINRSSDSTQPKSFYTLAIKGKFYYAGNQ